MSESYPIGWTEAKLADVAEFNPKHPTETNRAMPVSFVPMPAVDEHEGAILSPSVRPLAEIWSGFTHFSDGDVIFAKITPCMENGKAAIARDLVNGLACGSTEFHVLRPTGVVEASFLWRYLRQKSFRENAEAAMTGAVGQRRVPKPYLESHPVPVPPLPEQRRIVAKLDRLSARSRAARRYLARTTALAARAKQAILAAAFEGELTAEWRETHGGILEASTVGAVADASSGYGFPKHRQGKKAGQYPFAKVSDISRAVAASSGRLTTAENFVDDADLLTLRARPVPAGSTVFAKIGEALKLNRRALVQQATILDNNCMALTPRPNRIEAQFLYLFMQTIDLAPFSVATTVPSVRRGDVDAIEFNLPSLPEQREIVNRIEAAFTRIDRLAAEAARAAHLLDRLDERLLAKAFRGELVPQDPADEPAEALLARIRAARAAAPKPRRGRSARTEA